MPINYFSVSDNTEYLLILKKKTNQKRRIKIRFSAFNKLFRYKQMSGQRSTCCGRWNSYDLSNT